MLREATEKGKALIEVTKPRGKWEDGVQQRKCHGQWLPVNMFHDLERSAVWNGKVWHNLDGVQYKTNRDGEVPSVISLCSACIGECPACHNFALISDLKTNGICKECGVMRTELILREDA
ncbi:MAG: hypothetical protein CMF24_08820 [Ilumatobacter sp.]|nr:hypothetical protein [Ilumatobacter sp.]